MFPSSAKTDNLQNAANDVKDDLQNAANQAGRKVRSLYNTASDEISHASETVTTEIRSNPIRSSVIALGVGVLLGALIRR
ncbi:MAG: DUF883 family protein [Alphaproteobacteria bacterium]|nr:DUF883 family protein [Alphaproteobacteria bacterium]